MNFMIIALPRSRTTWLANFLTTEKTFCYHDPLAEMNSYKEINDLDAGRLTGIADTGVAWFDLSIFDCKKLVIERDLSAVDEEMSDMLGVSISHAELKRRMDLIDAPRVKFEDINNQLEFIWDYCTDGLPFDRLRAEYLVNMNVQVRELPIDVQRLENLKREIIW